LIKLSISHLGDRECRKRTPEELAKLPPNMRAPMDCPRERSDIRLEVDLDGQPVFRTVMHPTGLYKDGVSTVYKRFELKAGSHQVAVRMNDNLMTKPASTSARMSRDHPRPWAGDGDRLQPGSWRPVLQMITTAATYLDAAPGAAWPPLSRRTTHFLS
jgi:hypothetical protein